MTDEEALQCFDDDCWRCRQRKACERLENGTGSPCRNINAMSALRDRIARQNPRPLTLEELLGMDGEPVWVDVLGDKAWWVVIWSTERGKLTTDYGGWFDFRDYGKTWLAYRTKPEPPEREVNDG